MIRGARLVYTKNVPTHAELPKKSLVHQSSELSVIPLGYTYDYTADPLCKESIQFRMP